MQTKVMSAATYGSAGATVYFGKFSLNEVALTVGIIATVLTVAMNFWFQWRRDRREEKALGRKNGE